MISIENLFLAGPRLPWQRQYGRNKLGREAYTCFLLCVGLVHMTFPFDAVLLGINYGCFLVLYFMKIVRICVENLSLSMI